MEMNGKSKLTLLATVVVLVTLIGPTFFVMPAQAWTDPAGWYKTVPGVLAVDYYKLYPFKIDKSLKLGFSQFGELINSLDNVGLEYRDVDPFAPTAGIAVPAAIPKKNWVNGWLCNISYTTIEGVKRNVWASATHADMVDFGGPWLRVDFAGDKHDTYIWEDPKDPGYEIGNYAAGPKYGGRKTNGTAVTEPMKVLYEGPRRFVALLNTTIYDHPLYVTDDPTMDVPLVNILFTIIFNKDKKSVVILKDIKSIAPKLTVLGKMNVQFSDRGEVDLGTEALGFPSYAHFYVAGGVPAEGQPTAYNSTWVGTVKTATPSIKTKHGPEPKAIGTYDVAQVINFATKNVFFAAFWPSLSDWDIFGGSLWWRSLTAADPHHVDIPTPPGEPHPTPFYIGEWDFELTDTLGVETHFRGVTVYGVTDRYDGDDAQRIHGVLNKIDSEVMYQLKEIFNPWDLVSAVKKGTSRWVQFFSGTVVTKEFKLASVPLYTGGDVLTKWPLYSVFADRVLVGGVLQTPEGVKALYGITETTYKYTINATGWIKFITAPPTGIYNIKVLYSTTGGRYEWIIVGNHSRAIDSIGAAMVSAAFKGKGIEIGLGGLDVQDAAWGPRVPYVLSNMGHKGTGHHPAIGYYDSIGRLFLKDDWCRIWPIASSNIIAVGGPRANIASEYFNEFTDAFMYSALGDGILALPCWKKNFYPGAGYAIISTYKDLNGTVGLVIWGWTGEDTYYAAKWFREVGIGQLGGFASGVTTIILEIRYVPHPPRVIAVKECLGTISETLVGVKGGIHPDP